MCYDIITGLIDTSIRRLYMYDKPGRLCRLPHKSCTADSILFAKEDIFCTTFVLGGRPTGWHVDSCVKIKYIYIYIYIYEY